MGYYVSGFEIRTPSMVLAEMQTVDGMIQTLAEDITAKLSSDDPTVKAFALFFTEWKTFFDSNKSGPSAWLSRGTTGTYNKVQEYRGRALDWRKVIESKGISTTGPIVPRPQNKTIAGFSRGVVFTALAGGTFLIWYLLRDRQ